MEVKINKEIRDYTENIYFGLSLRQFFFSVCACLTTIILYFIGKKFFGIETISWVCMLGALPFAILGFYKYNGMPAEQFIMAWVRTEFIIPKKMTFKPTNYYYELLKDKLENLEQKGKEKENEIVENTI